MSRNPLCEGLIEVAFHLSDVRSRRRIVEQAAFRRAISSAYYAVFHALCQVCCDGFGFWTAPAEQIEPVYRNLEHGKAKDALNSAAIRSLHDDMPSIANAFIELRRLREDADYSQPGRLGSTQKLLTRTETKTHIAAAAEAVHRLDGLPNDVRRRLAVILTVRSSRR